MHSAVVESWRRSPLTVADSRSAPGSGTSSRVTTTGPSGQNVVNALAEHELGVWCELPFASADVVQDRVPEDCVQGIVALEVARAPPDHDAQLHLGIELRLRIELDDRLARPDHRRRKLGEEERPLGERRRRVLVEVAAVVDTGTDDLPRSRDRGQQTGAVRWHTIGGRELSLERRERAAVGVHDREQRSHERSRANASPRSTATRGPDAVSIKASLIPRAATIARARRSRPASRG